MGRNSFMPKSRTPKSKSQAKQPKPKTSKSKAPRIPPTPDSTLEALQAATKTIEVTLEVSDLVPIPAQIEDVEGDEVLGDIPRATLMPVTSMLDAQLVAIPDDYDEPLPGEEPPPPVKPVKIYEGSVVIGEHEELLQALAHIRRIPLGKPIEVFANGILMARRPASWFERSASSVLDAEKILEDEETPTKSKWKRKPQRRK